MMMKHLMLLAATAVLSFQVNAIEPGYEPSVMAYMAIPFDARTPAQSAPTFGLRIDHQRVDKDTDPMQLVSFSGKVPLINLQYRRGDMPMLRVSGLNVIKYEYAGSAAAGTAVGASVDWVMVAMGVGVGGMIIASQEDNNEPKKDECLRDLQSVAFDRCAKYF